MADEAPQHSSSPSDGRPGRRERAWRDHPVLVTPAAALISAAPSARSSQTTTHFEAAGARQIAGLVTTAVRDQQLSLTAYLRP
ncbi:hypothetical protein AB0H88_06415 [Nonomuraea sp. NPDC050680]|uniref:hypothetical protein n=1 Tax=Nonomuraea sp. NPDC050680 TaxID=3154630 RepID=UPI0033E9DD18